MEVRGGARRPEVVRHGGHRKTFPELKTFYMILLGNSNQWMESLSEGNSQPFEAKKSKNGGDLELRCGGCDFRRWSGENRGRIPAREFSVLETQLGPERF
ncbi:uncharacterized protein LOC131630636 isoform X2 [Vicia villosa]|uniref:uncharacterized protein LOC131630635 isoform X2 n=1 Tax=Vicia villosa TaxID=3911 RepID=UPI00273B02FC|nr:uncharacterized protein LOC131630635 isoform X2 [Vicia villosa]XP_058757383.1 uncharacterized protein LOC131630636 isoform X2 [Vicia villosa]